MNYDISENSAKMRYVQVNWSARICVAYQKTDTIFRKLSTLAFILKRQWFINSNLSNSLSESNNISIDST